MTVVDTPVVEGFELSQLVLVMLRFDGINLPARRETLPIALHVPELMVLEYFTRGQHASLGHVISDVAGQTGADPDRLRAFVDQIAADGLLQEDRAAPNIAEAAGRVEGEPSGFDADDELVLLTPLTFRLLPTGYESIDHDGRVRARLSAVELSAASAFRTVATRDQALELHRGEAGPMALDNGRFDALIERLDVGGLLNRFDPENPGHSPHDRDAEMMRVMVGNQFRIRAAVDRHITKHDEGVAEREARLGVTLKKVIPIHHNGSVNMGALGMVMAYAQEYDGGRLADFYDFRPDWVAAERGVEEIAAEPGIFLFSNYIWSHPNNIDLCEKIKAFSPNSITIHGGPDTPKYPIDVKRYFEMHPFVDIAVHNEGELTLADCLDKLMPVLAAGGPPDLSVLRDCPGLSFRLGDEVITTDKRDRIADLDTIPSPYLNGMFDAIGEAAVLGVYLETNRGCPYGCTFCDWGSATLSRIRKFSMERVFAELEWCAQHKVSSVGLADANFGIFERDVEIADKMAELKAEYGYPEYCGCNYAKNTTKHLKKIVSTWVDAGIITQGVLSLQSIDEGVLKAVKRSNIKTEKYDDLALAFRRANLPLFIDLMLGLPGATRESFLDDLQDCIEREVTAKIHPTTLLTNSPMNDPEYKAEHKIEIKTKVGRVSHSPLDQMVVQTASYTKADYEEMKDLRRIYVMCENFGVLRQIARYVRHETNTREIDFYEQLRVRVNADPNRWPAIAHAFHAGPHVLAPPVSWKLLIDEVHQYVVDELGVPDDDTLATVLTVQHALLPAPEREFPVALDLAHDYGAWFALVLGNKERGEDWTEVVPSLRSFGPAVFEIDDPYHVCTTGLGYTFEKGYHDSWELKSPVARPVFVRPWSAA